MNPTHIPEIVKILEVRREARDIKTFVLDKRLNARPGQFCMIWIPDVGEKPFTFSKLDGNIEIMVRKVGEFTERLFSMDKGDVIGIRGPYGNGFKLEGRNICVVAGGIGIAPLIPLVDIAKKNGDLLLLLGFRTKSEIIGMDRFKDKNIEVIIATDDGSFGIEGSVCNVLEDLLMERRFDSIYSCGPELMMRRVMDLSLRYKIPCQLSLERYIKCGIGICGSCCLENGLLVCKDGPVFNAVDLRNTEFGAYKRDSSGSKVNF